MLIFAANYHAENGHQALHGMNSGCAEYYIGKTGRSHPPIYGRKRIRTLSPDRAIAMTGPCIYIDTVMK